jgi:hypothetical protein
MRSRSVAYGTAVLNDNFSCTWTLCSTQSGDGWPQRSQLQPDVPSLGRCVTLLPATFCNIGLGDPLSSCNKGFGFISSSFLLRNSRSQDTAIRVYDEAGNVIETHEHAGDFKEPWYTVTLPKRFRFLNAE